MKKLICAAFGMPEDSTDDAVVECAKTCATALAASAALTSQHDDAVRLAASHGTTTEALRIALAKETEAHTTLAAEVEKMKTDARDSAIKVEADKLHLAGKLNGKDGENFTKVALAMGLPEAVAIFGNRAAVPLKEVGVTGSTGEESADSAFGKLKLAADDLVKSGCSRGDAMIRAMSLHPELTKAAESLKSPHRS